MNETLDKSAISMKEMINLSIFLISAEKYVKAHMGKPECTWGFTKFGIKVLKKQQFLEYLRTLSLKFQKARTKIEVVLTLPCWLSQYPKNCSFNNILIP